MRENAICLMCTDRINEYMEKIALDAPVSPEYLASAVAGAIKDRALLFYFTWKTLQDMHPEIDADAVMAEASRRLGEYKAPNLGKVEDAEDAVLNQTSKAGMLAFDQEITKLTPEESIKVIRRCPHIEAFEELGCSKEERIKLCTKLLMPLDFALLAPYEKVRLEFPKNLAADDVCVMCTKTAE